MEYWINDRTQWASGMGMNFNDEEREEEENYKERKEKHSNEKLERGERERENKKAKRKKQYFEKAFYERQGERDVFYSFFISLNKHYQKFKLLMNPKFLHLLPK